MKKTLFATMIAGALSVASAATGSISAHSGTEYVFRGVSVGDDLLDFTAEVETHGVTVGVWAASYDVGNDVSDTEYDYYIGTSFKGFDLGLTYYDYSGNGYDFEAYVGKAIEVSDTIEFGATVYYGIDGGIDEQAILELSAGTSYKGFDLGVTLGDVDGSVADYYSVSIGKTFEYAGGEVAPYFAVSGVRGQSTSYAGVAIAF